MNSSQKQFGLIVAYLLPGFIGLAGLAPFAATVAAWLRPTEQAQAGLGPPVYAVLAATTIGMIVSCFRWLTIDQIHRWTGLVPPTWNDSRLEERLAAFDYLVESHYRYYQFVSNTLVAALVAYGLNRWFATSPLFGFTTDTGMLVLCGGLFAASRDALLKYYRRTDELLGSGAERKNRGSDSMYNGNHHEETAGGSAAAPTQSKPESKNTQAPVKPREPQPQVQETKPSQPAK